MSGTSETKTENSISANAKEGTETDCANEFWIRIKIKDEIKMKYIFKFVYCYVFSIWDK